MTEEEKLKHIYIAANDSNKLIQAYAKEFNLSDKEKFTFIWTVHVNMAAHLLVSLIDCGNDVKIVTDDFINDLVDGVKYMINEKKIKDNGH